MTDPMDELQQARDAVDAMVRKNVGGREQLEGIIEDAITQLKETFPFGAILVLKHLAWKAYTLGLERGMTGEAMRVTAERIKAELWGNDDDKG